MFHLTSMIVNIINVCLQCKILQLFKSCILDDSCMTDISGKLFQNEMVMEFTKFTIINIIPFSYVNMYTSDLHSFPL